MHVDETEKGFFVSWIDNSPQALSKQASNQVKERADMDDEQRQRKHIAEQIERARILEEEKAAKTQEKSGSEEENKSSSEERKPTGPISISIGAPISFSIGGTKKDSPPLPSAEPVKPASLPTEVETPQPIEASTEPVASTSALPAPTVAPAPIKLNAFKKANPLKANPLKAPKAPAAEKKPTQHSLTAVEQLMKEDQERKRRREMGESRERYGPALKRARA